MTNEWVKHDGSECPFEDGSKVLYKLREDIIGSGHGPDFVEDLRWGFASPGELFSNTSADIVEYKLVSGKLKGKTSSQLNLIGITGKAGSGKDTVADYLVSEHGYTKISFAAILKNMLRVAGLPEPANRDDKEKIVDGFEFSWRDAAQKLGTEWGRSLDTNIWVKLTMNSLDPFKKYVISDVRFDNEAEAVRKSGCLIHLTGREIDMGELSNHPSEAGVSFHNTDYLIYNSGSKEALYTVAEEILSDLKET